MRTGHRRRRLYGAAYISRLLDADVSKWMLDAYASPARDGHAISFGRMLALVAATGQHDLLRPLLRQIGCDLVVGEQVYNLEIGHLEAVVHQANTRLRQLKAVVEPLQARKGGT